MMILNSIQQAVNLVNPLEQICIIVPSYPIASNVVIEQIQIRKLNVDQKLKSRVQELNLPEANYEFAA
jgi:uncharacterized protein YpmS